MLLRKTFLSIGGQSRRNNLRAINLTFNPLNIPTLKPIRPLRTHNTNSLERDIAAHTRRATNRIPDQRLILRARRALEVLDRDVGNGQVGRELVAQREVRLAVALGDFDGVVDVGDRHGVVRYVGDGARAAAALEIAGERGRDARPDFDACAV